MSTATYSPAVRAQLDQLGAAMEALGVRERVVLAGALLNLRREGEHPESRALWSAMFALTEGADEARLAALVNTLEVLGPRMWQAITEVADRYCTGDPARRNVWAALGGLARSMEVS